MRPPCTARRRPSRRVGGFSLAEAVVSILIVGGLLVAALNTLGAARIGRYKLSEQNRGPLLAQALMSEILQQPYQDAQDPGGFGLEDGEGSAGRTDFDDIDDYDGWTASPPLNKDGSAIPGLEGYQRSVQVVWGDPDDLAQTSANPTGIKRINVTVQRDGRVIAGPFAIRTEAWPADLQGDGAGN